MRDLLDAIKDRLDTNAAGIKTGIAVKPPDTGSQPYWVVARTSTMLSGSIGPADLDTDRGSIIQIKSVGTSYTQASAAHDLAEQTIKGLDPDGIQVMLIVTEQTNGPFREDATAPEPSTFWCDLLVRVWTTPS